ncbi:M48 family metalloprotease [Pseudanabaena sp. FACHB-2040]|uniref:M48 family metalloprotease n=1 Tax=Pseudanabaena sp. FACHB-2040 TaxID=2692859 RepID=UPI0016875007|nr:M48 family metalloprotease [Pseudanabaena sp. FACHB-2040]MBD2258084.1 M48 family metalloprotease [Pseudanabaena sp. FACHB-2040]
MAESFEPRSESLQPAEPLPSAEELLQTGLQAIKTKDYSAAIAALTALQQANASPSYHLQAQMGLIRAYRHLGEQQTAADLCRPLTSHRNPQVQEWARRTLATLQTSSSDSATPPTVVNDRIADPSTAAPEVGPLAADLSGFTPISSKPSTSGSISSPPVLASSAPETSHLTTASEDQASSSAAARMNDSQISPLNPSDNDSPTASLFHYQQLNSNDTGPEPPNRLSSSSPSLEPPQETIPLASEFVEPTEGVASGTVGTSTGVRSLPPLPLLKLWFVIGLTFVALLWVVNAVLVSSLGLISSLSRRLYQLTPQAPLISFQDSYAVAVGVFLIALLLASPWVMDFLLRRLYRQTPLSPRQFKANYPEALRTVRQTCLRWGWTLPELQLLPTEAPLCFSYGWLPSNMRIVVSQGLIDQMEDSELATLYAYELGHMRCWDLPVMSGLGTLLFLVYQGYWQTAQWGDRQRQPFLRALLGLFASLCYALFWLLRKVGLWLSRLRSLYCDRTAVELTHNPAGYSQSLLKLTQGIATHIEQQGYTPALLESLDLLTPLSHQLALSPGSCLSSTNLASLTAWDRQNPYRQWLSWNIPQALLGERLAALEQAGASLGLLPADAASTRIQIGSKPTGGQYLPTLLAQGAPLVGLLIGLIVAMFLWFLGGVMEAFDGWFLSWLYRDVSVLKGIAFLGLGIGLMLPVNRLFPDIRSGNVLTNPSLENLLKNPLALPTDSQPVQLQGTLIGRRGIANWLCQDVMLKTSSGLVRLHILSTLGPIGNFFSPITHPTTWRDRTGGVIGWVRRGATLWVDVDRLQQSGKILQIANHPLWATLLSLACCAWGVYILFRGY